VRVLLLCDMEGVAGIEAWEQVMGGSPQYDEGRRLLTGEVNAAIRGPRPAGPPRLWWLTVMARAVAGASRV